MTEQFSEHQKADWKEVHKVTCPTYKKVIDKWEKERKERREKEERQQGEHAKIARLMLYQVVAAAGDVPSQTTSEGQPRDEDEMYPAYVLHLGGPNFSDGDVGRAMMEQLSQLRLQKNCGATEKRSKRSGGRITLSVPHLGGLEE